jgi:hypothetical protein
VGEENTHLQLPTAILFYSSRKKKVGREILVKFRFRTQAD